MTVYLTPRWRASAAAICLACLPAIVVAQRQSGEYARIARSDFFQFFGVTEVGRRRALNGETTIALATGGFRDKISLSVTVDKGNAIRSARLVLDRQWVGNRNSINPFATDIAKSFLATFVSPADERQSEYFVRALGAYKGERDSVIVLREAATPPRITPPDVKQALDAFAGTRPRFAIKMSASELRFENRSDSAHPRLQLTIIRLNVPQNTATAAPTTVVTESGAELAAALGVPEALTGQPYIAIINREKATEADDRLPRKLMATPGELLIVLQLFVAQEGVIELAVHDGRSGHAIVVVGASTALDTTRYLDPWARGSFLEREHNRGGAAAVASPDHPREWLIPTAQLRRVAYAAIVPLAAVRRLETFRSIGATEPAVAAAEYQRLLRTGSDSVPADSTLAGLGFVLLAQHRAREALSSFMILETMHPASSRAALGAGLASLAVNDTSSAVAHFRHAAARAGADSSLALTDRMTVRARSTDLLERFGPRQSP